MDELPEGPDFKPEDIDQIVKLHGRGIGAERKEAIMKRLGQEKQRFIQQQEERSNDRKQDKSRKR